uniref:peptidoglycan DD-metalloendopeptidase family protein n=1 Tax=uncultured Maritalea sp. TaxID=757249 RepID=UPI00262546E1
SVNTATNANLAQAMPNAVAATQLPPAGQYLSASNSRAPYIPAATVGPSVNTQNIDTRDPLTSGVYPQVQAAPVLGQSAASQSQIVRQQLPTLTPITVTSTQSMPAMPSLAEVDLNTAPKIDNTTTASIAGALAPRAVPDNAFTHKIEAGESLYAIARRYDVTTDSIVAANGMISPDRIFVGQDIIVPGRPGMVAPKYTTPDVKATVAPVKVASASTPPAAIPTAAPAVSASAAKPAEPVVPTPTAAVAPKTVETAEVAPRPISRPTGLATTAPKAAVATTPEKAEEPKPAPAEKVTTTASIAPVKVETPQAKAPQAVAGSFRWPVKGRVIADFRASKNTGVNIEVPEGSSIRAAENGEVIYVGSAVEGFGNLVLIKHSNGYVSAYAHLKDITVAKGAAVNRGDSIGTAGMTGAVSRPQLHFELRKGATPVDPLPLLAS